MATDIKVFVSSTSKDLETYRAVARLTILDLGWKPVMMEHASVAMSGQTVEQCRNLLQGCQLMLLIVAFRQGWVPTKEQGGNGVDSITAFELEYARQNNIAVLPLLAQDSWPGNLWENDAAARSWVETFRANLNQFAAFFAHEPPAVKESESLPAFRAQLRSALLDHKERLLTMSSNAASDPCSADFDSASMALHSGRCIPFIGQCVYGDGPLSTTALIQALGDVSSHEPCLATAAEYCERFVRSREGFLERLEEIIDEMAAQAETPEIFTLLKKIKRPPLVVSTTIDINLEKQLDTPLIICHVIRSLGGEHDGKILLFKGPQDTNPKFCTADNVDLTTAENAMVIYKPLGSPFLNKRLDPELEIDTVVMTESDHLVLLSRMQNQSTGVPTAFSRHFQRNPFVFLGYPLDVWHVRLLGLIFEFLAQPSKCPSISVRQPSSRMEELSWRRLNLDLLTMDPNEFARKVCATYE